MIIFFCFSRTPILTYVTAHVHPHLNQHETIHKIMVPEDLPALPSNSLVPLSGSLASYVDGKLENHFNTTSKSKPLDDITAPNKTTVTEQQSKIRVKANGSILPNKALDKTDSNSNSNARKLSHPRIKYSGVKNAIKTSNIPPSTPNKVDKINEDDSHKHPELTSPLNLDKLFPNVMSEGVSFVQHSHAARAVSGEVDDLSHYADIDDIELPDGSKIGYPTDIKRFVNILPNINNHNAHDSPILPILPIPSHHLNSNFGRTEPEPWAFNPTGNLVRKEPLPTSLPRLSFSSDTCDFTPPSAGGTSGVASVDDSLEIYSCRHCGKTYRWKSTLRRHENDECGDKKPAHECPYCPYKAKQRGNLGVHVRKHHINQPQLETRRKKRSTFERSEKSARCGAKIGSKQK